MSLRRLLRPPTGGLAALRTLCLALVACGLSGCDVDAPERPIRLSLVAASSLTEVMRDVERGFEAAHPTIDVRVDFAGSQVLRLQIEQGLEADLFASADERHMLALVESGRVTDFEPFASNRLALAVPISNPAGIESIEDLADAQRIVVGTPESPIGRYTLQLLDRIGGTLGQDLQRRVEGRVASQESNVRLARAKVALGEADAAIVYLTDVTAREDVTVVRIPDHLNVEATYHIGTLDSGRPPGAAARFRAYLESDEGRRLLEARGFEPASR